MDIRGKFILHVCPCYPMTSSCFVAFCVNIISYSWLTFVPAALMLLSNCVSALFLLTTPLFCCLICFERDPVVLMVYFVLVVTPHPPPPKKKYTNWEKERTGMVEKFEMK